jgi:HTH-type transcriptional regulator/antitoxin HigA
MKLSHAFENSAQYWLNLDNSYRLWLQGNEEKKGNPVEVRASIYARMPIRDMMHKGWLAKTRQIEELKMQVLDFWNIQTLDFSFLDQTVLPKFKKSDAFNQFNASYAATWYEMAKKVSREFSCGTYNKAKLQQLYKKLSGFTYQTDGIGNFLHELNRCGVKFFVLPHLEKTYLDGASFIKDDNPVIVYTARYKRIDNFWFTMAHEIAHVLRHLDDETPFILDNLIEKSDDKIEKEANSMASIALKHPKILNKLEPKFGYLTKGNIVDCAEQLNVHPSIIIGALAFNDTISFRNLRLFNENVLYLIPEEYLHDSVKID